MKVLFLSLALAALCVAQNPEPMEHQVVPIVHGDIHEIRNAIEHFGFATAPPIAGNSIVLYGRKDQVDAAVEAIKRLDVPPAPVPDIEVTAYLITASMGPNTESAPPLPDGLNAVVTQLKDLFHYRGYRLLDSAVVRSRNGSSGQVEGATSAPDSSVRNKTIYSFGFDRAILSGDKNRVIHLEHLRLDLKSPFVLGPSAQNIQYASSNIRTDVDIREGQKVVVGKASTASGGDGALILVLSAKVVE